MPNDKDSSPERSLREKQSIRTKIAYKRVFGSEDGHLVLLDLMNVTNVFTSTYDSSHKEPIHEMLIAEGQRNLINRILTEIGMDIEEYIKCFNEAEEAGVYEDEK